MALPFWPKIVDPGSLGTSGFGDGRGHGPPHDQGGREGGGQGEGPSDR